MCVYLCSVHFDHCFENYVLLLFAHLNFGFELVVIAAECTHIYLIFTSFSSFSLALGQTFIAFHSSYVLKMPILYFILPPLAQLLTLYEKESFTPGKNNYRLTLSSIHIYNHLQVWPILASCGKLSI